MRLTRKYEHISRNSKTMQKKINKKENFTFFYIKIDWRREIRFLEGPTDRQQQK